MAKFQVNNRTIATNGAGKNVVQLAASSGRVAVELREVARLYGLPVSDVERILNRCVTSATATAAATTFSSSAADDSAEAVVVNRTGQPTGKVKAEAKTKKPALIPANPLGPRILDPARIMAQEVRESFHAALRKEVQAQWLRLIEPFEDSVVEFVPEEITRGYVRGKIRLPLALSVSSSSETETENKAYDQCPRSANISRVANRHRRWSSDGCTYVTATLPVEEQLAGDEYELGVSVTVYVARVRQSKIFTATNTNLMKNSSDARDHDKEIASSGRDSSSNMLAQGVTALLSRRGERFVTLLAQAALPQHLLDRFDVRCTERDEGNRTIIGITSLDGTSLRQYAREISSWSDSAAGSGTGQLSAGDGGGVRSDIKYLLQFLNEVSCTQVSTKLGGETVEYKLF
jgi:hypothetical protein